MKKKLPCINSSCHVFAQSISKDVRELKARVQTFLDEKEAMMGEHQELMKQKAKLELSIKDLQDELDGDSGAKVSRATWSWEIWPGLNKCMGVSNACGCKERHPYKIVYESKIWVSGKNRCANNLAGKASFDFVFVMHVDIW